MTLPEKLASINELKRKADELKPPKDWDQAFLQKVKIEFTYKLIRETNAKLSNSDASDLDRHPLTIAVFFHQRFLNEIHPFDDGNGRIGRIFTNLILIKKGYPPLFIQDVDRLEYLRRFELTEKEPNAMLDFLADRLIESLRAKIEYIERGGAN
jgi:Fic family protein